MSSDIVVRTVVPILLLIGLGFFSREMGFLKSGDERVFSGYIYYFALPALFFVKMVETNFIMEETLRFMFAGAKPHNKTIISVIKDEKEEAAIKILRNILGDLDEPGEGIVFSVPLERVEGFKPEI